LIPLKPFALPRPNFLGFASLDNKKAPEIRGLDQMPAWQTQAFSEIRIIPTQLSMAEPSY
jgi:hypothetical protein